MKQFKFPKPPMNYCAPTDFHCEVKIDYFFSSMLIFYNNCYFNGVASPINFTFSILELGVSMKLRIIWCEL